MLSFQTCQLFVYYLYIYSSLSTYDRIKNSIKNSIKLRII